MSLIPSAIDNFTVFSSAEVSEDGCRYWLTGDTGALDYDFNYAIFLMLNPSTAKAGSHDPTSRKVVGFTRRLRARRWAIVNMFAKRATYPVDLFADGYDAAVGQYNNAMLRRTFLQFGRAVPIIAAWGSVSVSAADKAKINLRADEVKGMAKEYKTPLKCLGLAQDGNPRHPLMLSYKAPLMDYSYVP